MNNGLSRNRELILDLAEQLEGATVPDMVERLKIERCLARQLAMRCLKAGLMTKTDDRNPVFTQ